ncbi:MAG: peptidoglycan editing factor PgeF [Tatlockia sp.]|jgi:hypothetical protein
MEILTKLNANWPAPTNVFAFTTKRTTGFSEAHYAKNNLALHVGDNRDAVIANRAALRNSCSLPNEPEWLDQTHSTDCVLVEETANRAADAAITRVPNSVLAIMTADCLPILLCNKAGMEVAAIHAGWRGLVNGVIENTVEKMHSKPEQLLAWVGPAICQTCFEVGQEVLEAFQNRYGFAKTAFYPQGEKWRANLPQLAALVLQATGVSAIYQSNQCTFENKNDFYSYRREPQTGRIVSLIWFNE